MKKLTKLAIAAAVVASISASASAADIMAAKPYSAYLQDGRGLVTTSGTGLCWRTGYWTPADAVVVGCDGVEAAAPMAAAPVPAPAPAPVPVVSSEKVTYSADAFFDFDKSIVKPEGQEALDKLVKHMEGVDIEVIIATGHTDWTGTEEYNQALSIRRAEAVKAYMVSKGVDPKQIYTEGKGELQPVASNKTREGRAKNRRVEIEVVGKR